MQNQATMKVWTKEMVQELIRTNDQALARAILQLYKRQTAAEQSMERTQEHNGVGFNSRDAAFLTSIAKALPRWNNRMTARQIATARPMMMKYWRQLLDVIAENGGVINIKKGRSLVAPEIEDAEFEEVAVAPAPRLPAPAAGHAMYGMF